MSGKQNNTHETNKIVLLFLPLVERFFDIDEQFITDVGKSLRKSGENKDPQKYIAKALGYGLITGVLLWIIGSVAAYVLIMYVGGLGDITTISISNQTLRGIIQFLKVPVFILFSGLFSGLIGLTIVTAIYIFRPRVNANSRKREINMLLPGAVAYMYALSVGGVNQIEIIESMAEEEQTYGEVSREFRTIVNEIKYFGTDYRTAIKKQAEITPSSKLSEFYSDMISILSSGGNLELFLKDKKRKYIRTSKKEQKEILETLELFGEMYMTLSLFPILLIIVLVIMGIIGDVQTTLLFGTVYLLIPMISVGFIVMVATVKPDEIGSGLLKYNDKIARDTEVSVSKGGLSKKHIDSHEMFSQIDKTERMNRLKEIIRAPHIFFRRYPLYTLFITVPLMIVIYVFLFTSGGIPLSVEDITTNVIWGTFVLLYLPVYLLGIPIAFFYELKTRRKNAIVKNLSETLRKLANTNETGMTLFESLDEVSNSSSGKIAKEFNSISTKVQYGKSVTEAFVEFNNKYDVPRLARIVQLITKAQEASNQISEVLITAAEVSENQDEIESDRKQNARMQVVIIVMTFITLLGVMALLQTQFIDVMAELVDSSGGGSSGVDSNAGGSEFGASLNPDRLSMLFFHAVALQAIFSGIISGYMRDANLIAGVKYAIILQTIALIVWIGVV